MQEFSWQVNKKTEQLNDRRRILSSVTSLFNAIALAGAAYILFSVHYDKQFKLFLIGLGLLLCHAIRLVSFWLMEFFYVRWFYKESLYLIGKALESTISLSPSLQQARNGKYSSYKALSLLICNRPYTAMLLLILGVIGIYLIIPFLVLLYFLHLKFFSLSEIADIESDFLKNSGNHPAVKGLFLVSNQDEFNKVVQEVINISEREKGTMK